MSAVVRAEGLRRHFQGDGEPVRAVDGVDLVVDRGEAVSIMGPSGCGKSTLLHLLGGLERPDAGTLIVGDQRVDRLSEASWARLRRRTIGFVFQAFHLVDELTAAENVELPGAAGRHVPPGGPAQGDRAARPPGRGRPGRTPARPALRRRAPAGGAGPGRWSTNP